MEMWVWHWTQQQIIMMACEEWHTPLRWENISSFPQFKPTDKSAASLIWSDLILSGFTEPDKHVQDVLETESKYPL